MADEEEGLQALCSTSSADCEGPAVKEGRCNAPTFTVQDAVDSLGFGRFHYLLLFCGGSVFAADAMEMMLLSFLGSAVMCEWGVSATQESLLSTVVFIGVMFGCTAWGALADAKGRRMGFLASTLFTLVCGLASAAAPNFLWLLLLRGLVGLGLGGAPVAVTLFLEWAPMGYRGTRLVLLQGFWTVGTVIEAGLAWLLLNGAGWRWLLVASAVPLAALALLYPLVPESPFFLAAQGRLQDAEAELRQAAASLGKSLPYGTLSGSRAAPAVPWTPSPTAACVSDCPLLPSYTCPEQGGADTRALMENAEPTTPSKRSRRWAVGVVRTATSPMMHLFGPAQQVTSLLMVFIWFSHLLLYYGLVLLTPLEQTQKVKNECGEGGRLVLADSALKAVFIVSFFEGLGVVSTWLLIDVLGRKRTMLLASVLVSLACGGLVAFPDWATIGMAGARMSIMCGITTLYIYTPEAYPTSIRTMSLGFFSAIGRFGAMIAPFLTVGLARAQQLPLSAGVLALTALLTALAVAFLPLETGGRELELGPSGADKECKALGRQAVGPADPKQAHRVRPPRPGQLDVASLAPRNSSD